MYFVKGEIHEKYLHLCHLGMKNFFEKYISVMVKLSELSVILTARCGLRVMGSSPLEYMVLKYR